MFDGFLRAVVSPLMTSLLGAPDGLVMGGRTYDVIRGTISIDQEPGDVDGLSRPERIERVTVMVQLPSDHERFNLESPARYLGEDGWALERVQSDDGSIAELVLMRAQAMRLSRERSRR